MKRVLVYIALAACVVAGTSCARQNPVASRPGGEGARVVGPFGPLMAAVPTRLEGVDQVTGTIGPGAQYLLCRPAAWNGDLIVYAHGYIVPAAPVAVPTADDVGPLRDLLLQRGYAVAYSSFSENGYALKDGALWTHQLRGLFTSKFGPPKKTYLVGHSLGGIVALMLAEEHPDIYAGALPICGMLGGTRLELGYVSHVRVLFDYFYSGILPGSLLELPADLDLNRDVVLPAVAAMQANPAGAFAISQIAQTPIPFTSGEELVASVVQALVLQAVELDDFLGRTHSHSFFDNTKVEYTGALPAPLLADINARVARFSDAPDAAAYMKNWYEPTGNLHIPVLSLHTRWDPVVPSFHEAEYRTRVDAAGCGSWLLQRIATRYGHVGYEAPEMLAAIEDLVLWAEAGVVPTP